MISQKFMLYISFPVSLLHTFTKWDTHHSDITLLRLFQTIVIVHSFSSNTNFASTYIPYTIYILGSIGIPFITVASNYNCTACLIYDLLYVKRKINFTKKYVITKHTSAMH